MMIINSIMFSGRTRRPRQTYLKHRQLTFIITQNTRRHYTKYCTHVRSHNKTNMARPRGRQMDQFNFWPSKMASKHKNLVDEEGQKEKSCYTNCRNQLNLKTDHKIQENFKRNPFFTVISSVLHVEEDFGKRKLYNRTHVRCQIYLRSEAQANK